MLNVPKVPAAFWAVMVGLSSPSGSDMGREPVSVLSVASSVTAPSVSPEKKERSSAPVTVMVTTWVVLSEAVTVNLSSGVSPASRALVADLALSKV